MPRMCKTLGSIPSHTQKSKSESYLLWSFSVAFSSSTLITTLGIELLDYIIIKSVIIDNIFQNEQIEPYFKNYWSHTKIFILMV